MNIFSQKRPKYGEDPNFSPNTIIGDGISFRGMIKGANSVMVSGLVFGDINVDGEVIVTETGYVKGDIVSTFAVVAGIVEGNITLTSYASLKSTASVTGDITSTALNIEDGAIFTGVSKMIVKSSSRDKKLRRINEAAAAMEAWAPQPAVELGDNLILDESDNLTNPIDFEEQFYNTDVDIEDLNELLEELVGEETSAAEKIIEDELDEIEFNICIDSPVSDSADDEIAADLHKNVDEAN
ncbi:MAG: polymer-forming cytoskeletal protein [Defluviitaleaceae bacterium]|nr:polymer-forming cytoskeletal protein [Defluviitaleaceae bacterium]